MTLEDCLGNCLCFILIFFFFLVVFHTDMTMHAHVTESVEALFIQTRDVRKIYVCVQRL